MTQVAGAVRSPTTGVRTAPVTVGESRQQNEQADDVGG